MILLKQTRRRNRRRATAGLGAPDDRSFILDLKAAGLMSDCAHSSAAEWKTIHARSWRFNLAEAVRNDRFE